ncbi:unnamed protein product [Rotaria sordida]|uniref:Uncharacterized protein n=1 Tax=Rotaria sordida TaxID=392033 RepID=A0A815Q7V4_9BILA|nr:unnamed protein product [Rotaria sordida]CAF1459722.1 unnamed protein product [Rotaria sordida]
MGNRVYYHIYSDTSPSNIASLVFTKAGDYVRRFFPQQRLFEPTMVITGTWYRVGAYDRQTDRLNTFQIVLATDSDRSFVFLLYHDLQWAGPAYTTAPYAQAGFNAGDGIAFEMLPYSRTKDIVRLVNESNVNVPGLFVFRVDTDEIDAGGCSINVSVVTLRPRISSQLGSTALNIQGPCFSNLTTLRCRFGSSSETVEGIVIDTFRAICLTPLAPVHGPIPVSLSIDNGVSYMPVSVFTYAPLQFGSDDVIIDTGNQDNLLNVLQYIDLTWRFSELSRNTFPNGTTIEIELVEVSLSNRSQLQQKNLPMILARDLAFNVTSFRLLLPESIANVTTCFIRVVARFEAKIYAGLNTGLLTVRSPTSFASESCVEWSRQQPEPSAWNGGILPCPMTRTQAIAAGRCCYESDSQCYRSNPNSNNCWLHQARSGHNENSAVECYVSKSSNIHGAGAECCYDFEGQLITRGTGAGTDDRYRSFVLPVQHFFEDTLPYLQCCMISTDVEMCNIYMYYRPPRRGSNTMGQSGGTWGDPHFITLDGTSYTFNGYGEYTYLAISNDQLPPGAFQSSNRAHVFMSQIRTMPLESNDVTVTRGFAARSSDPESQPISITVSRRENLIMRRGNELLEFEDNIHMLFFPEMTIERNPIDSTILTLSWTIGVTVQIKLVETTSPSVALVLNVAASVADTFRERTYGLLGIYDNEPNNDLRAQNGIVVNSNALLEQIHRQFGVTWAIDPDTSLFYYESGQSAEFFENQNRLFVPSFTEPINTAAEDASFRRTCKIDANSSPSSWNTAQRTCYYDMSITRDETFAQTSFDAGDEILAIKADLRNPPLFNVELPVSMKSKDGEQIHLIIDATSNYSMSVIVLSADHLPRDATFNTQTKVFQWTAIEGEDYVRIRAKDSTYNLTSTHDIVFQVKQADESSGIQSEMQSSLFFLAILFCMLFK